MTELAERLRLDLADALACDGEALTDLFERVIETPSDAKAHAKHALLSRRERCQHALALLAQMDGRNRVGRSDGPRIRNHIPELSVAVVAHRRLERDRVLDDADDALDL